MNLKEHYNHINLIIIFFYTLLNVESRIQVKCLNVKIINYNELRIPNPSTYYHLHLMTKAKEGSIMQEALLSEGQKLRT